MRTHTHSDAWDTETEAFNKAAKSANSIKLSILYQIDKAGAVNGLTPDEFVSANGGLINTIRRRFTDLWKEGKIRHHPNGLTRANSAGNQCVTWVIGNDPIGFQQRRKRKWVGLTDEEIKHAWSQLWYDLNNGKFAATDDPSRHTNVMFARALEAKLKEKNT